MESQPDATSEAPQGTAAPGTKKKAKSPKYTKGPLAFFQKMERGMSKAQHRMLKAVDAGVSTWREEREKSSRKARDGAIRDVVKNTAEALTKTLEGASGVPKDIVDGIDAKVKPKKVISLFIPRELR